MTHKSLGVALGLGLQLLLAGVLLQTADRRGEEAASDHGCHFVGRAVVAEVSEEVGGFWSGWWFGSCW